MNILLNKIYKIILFIMLLNSCMGQTNNNIVQQKKGGDFILFGKWKLIKRISLDLNNPLSKQEEFECTGSIITFNPNLFIIPKNNCFNSDVCSSPNYKIQKVNTFNYFEGDKSYIKLIGLKKSVEIITTNCEVPFTSIIILNKNNICFGMDGYEYFLERVTTIVKS